MHASSSPSPWLFSWTIVTNSGKPPHLGALGVSDDQQRVFSHVSEALRAAPKGSRGLVHKITINPVKPAYFYDDLVARADLDPESGTVVWREFPPRGGWGRLDAFFTAAAETIGDTLPPEAISAGLTDLEAEYERRKRAARHDPE